MCVMAEAITCLEVNLQLRNQSLHSLTGLQNSKSVCSRSEFEQVRASQSSKCEQVRVSSSKCKQVRVSSSKCEQQYVQSLGS